MTTFKIVESYTIKVDYQADPIKLIDKSDYGRIADDIIFGKYEVKGQREISYINSGNHLLPQSNKKVTIHLIQFNRNIQRKEAKKEVEEQGFRLAYLIELLTLGLRRHPEARLKAAIYALGSVIEGVHGGWFHICLSFSNGKRRLDRSGEELVFYKDDYCAVVEIAV